MRADEKLSGLLELEAANRNFIAGVRRRPLVIPEPTLASSKFLPVAHGADRSSSRAWIEPRSAISSGPTAMASHRYDSHAEIHGDNCDSLRQT